MASQPEDPSDPDHQPYVEVLTPRLSQQSDNEKTKILAEFNDETGVKNNQVSVLELFSFADSTDKLLMALGTLGAIGAGVLRPLMVLLLGNLINSFGSTTQGSSISSGFSSSVNKVARNLTIVGVVGLLAGYLQVYCWSLTASRQSKRIRSLYVNAIITKEIGWFDVNDPMQLASRVADATVTIQDGIGSKMSDMVHFSATVVAGIIIAFVKGWELTLILMAVVPFVALSGMLAKKVIIAATHDGMQAYAEAGAVAQESLSNIRTVHMFNSVQHFIEKYSRALEGATNAGIKKAFAVGWGSGLMYMMIFLMYALGFFLGAVFVARDQLDGNSCSGSSCYDGGRVITVFFAVMQGAMALGQAGPNLQAVFSACAAAFDVFELIKRPSLIEPTNDDQGKKLNHVSGDIDIDNVQFAYPSRPEVEVCRGYSLKIQAGETVALVGPSGSGKSTVISLLERFYDPLNGSVKIDGEDIRSLNVKWLRQQIGLVGQEPVLFATSIMENIRHGRPDASDSEVMEAAKMANAFNFIMEFPENFTTEVGERGAQLSGGQKQRIAIARAIIKNPPILLLDEATSALDTESERIVQASLDRLVAGSNRTTIIVAHRLSTIRDADRIAVHSGGRIVEIGSHEELLRIPNGHYRRLLEAQALEVSKEENNNESEMAGDPDSSRSTRGLVRSVTRISKSNVEFVEAEDADASGVDINESAQKDSKSRIWKMTLSEWKFMALGVLGAAVYGAVYPVNGLLIGVSIKLYSETYKTKHEMLHDMRYYSLYLGGGSFVLLVVMQRLSRGLGTAVRRHLHRPASSVVFARVIAVSTVSNASVWTENHRFFSVVSVTQEPPKLGRLARRRAEKQRLSDAVGSLQENSSCITPKKQHKGKKNRFNVHRYVVQQQMPLEDVLPLLQSEVRSKSLALPMVRQAVDSFYFHCAQLAERKGLSDELREQVLRYFDQELFKEEATPFVLGKTLNEAVFSSVIKLHLAGGDTEAAWKLINKLRRAVKTGKGDAPKLHFRTVSPLLEHECKHDQFLSAYSRWQQLKQYDVEWTSAMEDVLVQMVVSCVKNDQQKLNEYTAMSEDDTIESHFHAQMGTLLHDLQLTCREVSPSNAQRLLRAFRDAKYDVATVPSDTHMRPKCPCCGQALVKLGMSEQEREYMLAAIELRRTKVAPERTVKEFLDPFRHWLMLRHETFQLQTLAGSVKGSKPLHYVLDGPNIAYINQNFEAGTYRLDQVDDVAKELQSQGHLVSITMPAAYLADKFVVRIRSKHYRAMSRQGKFVTRERTTAEKAILARWKDQDMIYSCRTDFLSDDLFWLYASVLMGREGRVVTNDQGRDHVFALLNGYNSTSAKARTQKNGKRSVVDAAEQAEGEDSAPSISMDLVARWKDMTTVNIEIQHEETAHNSSDWTNLIPIEDIALLHPLPFSRVPQVTAPQHFHFPIAEQANQNEHPNQTQSQRKHTRWLCVHRNDLK